MVLAAGRPATTSVHPGVNNRTALMLEIAKLAAKRKERAAAPAAVPAHGSADPRRFKPFTGEGNQNRAGAVRSFTNALSLYLELSKIASKKWFVHAMLFLEGTASNYMHTVHSLTETDHTW